MSINNRDSLSGYRYEQLLINEASRILNRNARFAAGYQWIGTGSNALELDFVFQPLNSHSLYIFEIKFSKTYTLSDSLYNTQLARFEALQRSNLNSSLEFILVTNARVPDFFSKPPNLHIWQGINTPDEFSQKLVAYFSPGNFVYNYNNQSNMNYS